MRRTPTTIAALLIACAVTASSLRCSMPVLSRDVRTVDSKLVSSIRRIDIRRVPSTKSPSLVFTAFRVDSIEEVKVTTTTYGRAPDTSEQIEDLLFKGGLYCAIPLGTAVVVNTVDPNAYGFSPSGRRAFQTGALCALGVATAAIVARPVVKLVKNRRAVSTTSLRISRVDTVPCMVAISDGRTSLTTLRTSGADDAFNLSAHLDDLATDGDVQLTITPDQDTSVRKTIVVARETVAAIRLREAALRDSVRHAVLKQQAEQARLQAEVERRAAEERRREEERYRPLSYDAAIRQWKKFRTDEDAYADTVTTWRFKVRYTGTDRDVLGGSSRYAFGYLGEFKYPVHARGFGFGETPSTDDRVVVTGKFEYINSAGEVVLSVVRVKNEGYRD